MKPSNTGIELCTRTLQDSSGAVGSGGQNRADFHDFNSGLRRGLRFPAAGFEIGRFGIMHVIEHQDACPGGANPQAHGAQRVQVFVGAGPDHQ